MLDIPPKATILLDNCAFQNLHDKWIRPNRSSDELSRYEILVPLCLIMEILSNENAEQRERYIKSIKKLAGKRVLVIPEKVVLDEVLHALGRKQHADYCRDKEHHFEVWEKVWKNDSEAKTVKEWHKQRKDISLKRNRLLRKLVNKRKISDAPPGFESNWQIALPYFESQGDTHKLVSSLIEQAVKEKETGYKGKTPSFEEIRRIDYKTLKCTSVVVQHILALGWRYSFASKKEGGIPKRSAIDLEYVHYVGFVDIFITDDAEMKSILVKNVTVPHSNVISTQDFIRNYLPKI